MLFDICIEIKLYICNRFQEIESVSKKSIAILSLSIKSANFKKEEEHLCFRVYVYAHPFCIPSGVRYVSYRPRSFDGVCRYQ